LSALRMRVIVVGASKAFRTCEQPIIWNAKGCAETEYNGCRECLAVSWVIRDGICFEAVVRRCSRGAGSTC
jgi:hypothetical protein